MTLSFSNNITKISIPFRYDWEITPRIDYAQGNEISIPFRYDWEITPRIDYAQGNEISIPFRYDWEYPGILIYTKFLKDFNSF